jgi:hypothetical protein
MFGEFYRDAAVMRSADRKRTKSHFLRIFSTKSAPFSRYGPAESGDIGSGRPAGEVAGIDNILAFLEQGWYFAGNKIIGGRRFVPRWDVVFGRNWHFAVPQISSKATSQHALLGL